MTWKEIYTVLSLNLKFLGRDKFYLSDEYYKLLKDEGLIVETIYGGLIKGPELPTGVFIMHRPITVEVGKDDIVETSLRQNIQVTRCEGFQFIVNHWAQQNNASWMDKVNEAGISKLNEFTPYPIPEGVRRIDVKPVEKEGKYYNPFIYIPSGFYVVNKPAAKEHLLEINKINEAGAQEQLLRHIIAVN